LGKNRRDPNLPIDDQVTVLGFKEKDDKFKAVIVNYGCHPTVLGPDNLAISPDFPGEALTKLQGVYPETTFGFLNGSAGDVSTRFARREQTKREAERFGGIMAGKVITLLNKMSFASNKVHKSSEKEIIQREKIELKISIKDYPSLEELDNKIREWKRKLAGLENNDSSTGEVRIAETGLQGAKIQKKLAGLVDIMEKTAEINLWQIGQTVLVTIPGEMFSRLALEIKEQSPFKETMVVGYSNGHLGYIPDEAAYQDQGYEALSTPLKQGFGEKLVEETILKLQDLYRKSHT
jgi:hypothetical protein